MKEPETTETQGWQTTMLPVMTKFLIGLTVFFFMASAVQLVYLQREISNNPKLDPNTIFQHVPETARQGESYSMDPFMRGLLHLEYNAVARRYHQANVSLMSRIWTKYLSFVTGMILCVVGAAFILGKLSSPETVLQGKTHAMSFYVASSSPGIILATLGTVLMIVSLFAHRQIEVVDVPVYIPEKFVTSSRASSSSTIKDLLEELRNVGVFDHNDVNAPSEDPNERRKVLQKIEDNLPK